MWVELLTWNGNVITGVLQNDPHCIPTLKSGARVTIKQAEVLDYIKSFNDGRTEDNEMGKLIMKFQAKRAP